MILLKHRRKSFRAAAADDYRSTVLADNPLFYYRLGEASGTDAYDEVAAANNGTYYNTPDLGETGAISGDSNTAVKFKEASSEYAETVTLSSETSLLPCTIECFMKTDGASDDGAGIVFYRSGGSSASGLNMYSASTSVKRLGYHWRDQSATWTFSTGPTLSDNTWYYVALVVESTKATFYVIEEDGTVTTAEKTTSHSALDISNDGWKIGRDPFQTRYFQGYLDEVAIYDQALSQSTLEAHAAAAGFTSSGGTTSYATDGMTLDATWTSSNTAYQDLYSATSASAKVTCNFDKDDTGILMESGGTGDGLILYIYNETLYFQCGDGASSGGDSNTGEVSYTITDTSARDFIIEWSADTSGCALYVDGTLSGTDAFSNDLLAGDNHGTIEKGSGSAVAANRGSFTHSDSFSGTVTSAQIFVGEVTSDVSEL